MKMPKESVLYSLRHAYGKRLVEFGADVWTIMKLMGHSSVTVSQRYVHPSLEPIERAFERFEALNIAARQKVGTVLGTVTSDGPDSIQ